MKIITILSLLLISTLTFAGPGGGHSHGHGHSHSSPDISKDKTKELGAFHIKRLIKSEKLNASWKDATYVSSEKKVFGKQKEWVITFDNKKGIKGKKLYIFLKLSGDFVAANFSGK